MRKQNLPLPTGELAVRYDAGENTHELARVFRVRPNAIWRCLVAAGVKLRPRGRPRGWRKRGGPLWISVRGYLLTNDRDGKQCCIHRGCWEAHHGPIPSGHVVHHVDGDRLNNEAENLACMTNGEHTTLHKTRTPKEAE